MRAVYFFLLLFTNTNGLAQELAPVNCQDSAVIVEHHSISLEYNELAELPKWVAYKLTPESFNPNIVRSNNFREDSLVLTGSATPSDYYGSGYDRGHLAPAGSMKANEISMSESFLMSNICPQLPSFNRGIWRRLEEKVRFWAETSDSLFVITGPLLNEPIDTIGYNKVFVPRAFFKTILSFKNSETSAIAFLIPHAKSDKAIYSFATSIDEVEILVNSDFYCKFNIPSIDTLEMNSSVKTFLYGNKVSE